MPESTGLNPAVRCRGMCVMLGDKSLSHRALILAALAKGQSRIENLANGQDIRSTIRVLRDLGTSITLAPDSASAIVEGRSGVFDPPDHPLDCGNSATTMQLVAGVLAAQPFESVLSGDSSIHRRPMGRTMAPLREMGADITTGPGGRPPITIHGGRLIGISHRPEVPSAQIKSAVILAGLFATGDTIVHETLQTRDHTERLLANLAGRNVVNVDRLSRSITVNGDNLPLPPFDIVIPGDPSSAAYPVALATLLPESTFTAPFVSLNPGRTAFFRHLQAMGAHIIMTPDPHQSTATLGEPVGEITVTSSKLKNIPIDPARIPAIIDEIPLLSVVACLSERPWEITGAERLREKESDRITTTVDMLRCLGAEVTESRDGLGGMGSQVFKGGSVDTMGDHRIAMTAAVAAWCAKGPTVINDIDCINISFPGFFDCMKDFVEYPPDQHS